MIDCHVLELLARVICGDKVANGGEEHEELPLCFFGYAGVLVHHSPLLAFFTIDH